MLVHIVFVILDYFVMMNHSLLLLLNGTFLNTKGTFNNTETGWFFDLYQKERRKQQGYVENINYTKVSITAVIMFGFPVVALATFCIIRLRVNRLQRDGSFIMSRRQFLELVPPSPYLPKSQSGKASTNLYEAIENRGSQTSCKLHKTSEQSRTIYTGYNSNSRRYSGATDPILDTKIPLTKIPSIKHYRKNEILCLYNQQQGLYS